jgi:hypothetical protein
MTQDEIVAALLSAARKVVENRFPAQSGQIWGGVEPQLREAAQRLVTEAVEKTRAENRQKEERSKASEARAKVEAENASRAVEAEREQAQAVADDPANVPLALRKLDPEQPR